MVRHFPVAGSVYSYVGRGWNQSLGFIVGWVLLLDYVLIPTVTAISSAVYAAELIPTIPYTAWLIFFILGLGTINLLGIKITANFSVLILVFGLIVIFLGFGLWINAIMHAKEGMHIMRLLSLKPFHFDSLQGLSQATSLAVFGYLGFDAISTLAEEANNPSKDIPRAMSLTLLIGCLIVVITGYLGVLVIPNWKELMHDPSWVNATLFHVSFITGGKLFSLIYTIAFIAAMVVTNIVGTASAARLLFGMGRDKVIPSCFSVVNKKWKTPHFSLLFIMCIEVILGLFFSQGQIVEVINYGAIFGFTMLNMTVIKFTLSNKDEYKRDKFKLNIIFPFIGLLILLFLGYGVREKTLFIGTLWLLLGILYLVVRVFPMKQQLSLPSHDS